MMKRIEVVGAVLIKNGKILAAKRSESMALPGLWEFPGGKIEPGETAAQALQREITEELKCDVEIEGYLTTTDYTYPFGIVSLATYYATLKGADPVLTEHAEIRWLTPAELFDVEWAPADIPAVEILARRTDLE
jgi:8-oxo-dGTP diphosphatase